jgi:DNA-binding XRE family transcriptional regulator
MVRRKKPSSEEVSAMRERLMERARAGALRYPFAVVEIRKTLGLTQDQFAKLLRMPRSHIAAIEQGNANPTIETMERIGKMFNFTIGFVPRNPRPDEPQSIVNS